MQDETLGDNYYWGRKIFITKRYTMPTCKLHITYDTCCFKDWEECGDFDEYTPFYTFLMNDFYKRMDFNPSGYLEFNKISVVRDDVILDFESYIDYMEETEKYVDDSSYYLHRFADSFFNVVSFFESAEKAEKVFDNSSYCNNEKIILAIFGTLFYTESETFSDYLKGNLDKAKKYLSDTNNTTVVEKLRAMGYEI